MSEPARVCQREDMPLSINALLAWPSGGLLSNHAQTLASRWLL